MKKETLRQGSSSSEESAGRDSVISLTNGYHVNGSSTHIIPPDENESKYQGWSKYCISVEPLSFSIFFLFVFSNASSLNLIQRNSCNVQFNRSDEDCYKSLNMTERPFIDEQSAEIHMIITLTSMISPAFLSLFVGPWSEKNGRKPFIVLTFIGFTCTYIAVGVMSFFQRLDPHYFILSSLPMFFTGGMAGFNICSYCYLCDIFDCDVRTFRFNIAFSVGMLGSLLAHSSVTEVYIISGRYGYPVVFFICAFVSFLSLLYSMFILRETVKHIKITWMFEVSYLTSIIDLMLRRPRNELIVILLSITMILSTGLITSGEIQVSYLIGKSEYMWTLGYYNMFSAVTSIVSVVSSCLGSLILKQYLRLQNTTIIIVAAVVLVVSSFFRSWAANDFQFWVSSCVMNFYSLIQPTANAEMSKHVDYADLGKLYSFTSLIDCISALTAAPIYTAVYDSLVFYGLTLKTFNVSTILGVIVGISALIIRLIIWRKERSYEVTVNM